MKIPQVGQHVHYQPPHYFHPEKWENGIVKEVRDSDPDNIAIFVVYNCGGEWDRYREYTAARTNLEDLKDGWRHA